MWRGEDFLVLESVDATECWDIGVLPQLPERRSQRTAEGEQGKE